MNSPHSSAFDTTKLNMLKSFAKDEGLRFPEIAVMVIVGESPIVIDSDYTRIMMRVKIAWSLIRCGLFYDNHHFFMTDDESYKPLTLESALTLLLNPYITYWSKS